MGDTRGQHQLHRIRRLAFVYSLALVYLFILQVTTMSQDPPAGSRKPKAVWNRQEMDALVDFCHEKAIRTGSLSFKAASFNTLVDKIKIALQNGHQ